MVPGGRTRNERSCLYNPQTENELETGAQEGDPRPALVLAT